MILALEHLGVDWELEIELVQLPAVAVAVVALHNHE